MVIKILLSHHYKRAALIYLLASNRPGKKRTLSPYPSANSGVFFFSFPADSAFPINDRRPPALISIHKANGLAALEVSECVAREIVSPKIYHTYPVLIPGPLFLTVTTPGDRTASRRSTGKMAI